MDNKAFFRKNMLSLRNELSFRNEKDCQIRRKVLELLSGMEYISLFLYASMGSEADTKGIVRELYGNKEIFVPHTIRGEMLPLKLDCMERILRTDKLGNVFSDEEANLLCDCGNSLILSDNLIKIDVTLAPMLAFDKYCRRLGYGGGYYDRFFSRASTFKIGLAYDEQQNDCINFEEHDVPLDIIVTPTRIIRRV